MVEGEAILIFGGSSGIGRKTAAEYTRAGFTVHIGTSHPEKTAEIKAGFMRFEELDIGQLPVYIFPADVRDKTQIARAAQAAKDKGPAITRVVFSQAAGMDHFIKPLHERHLDALRALTAKTPIDELSGEKREIVEEKLAAMRDDLAVWTEEALPNAVNVLFRGTVNAIEVLGGTFPRGFKGVILNSTWGDLSGVLGVEIPLLYKPVHLAKGMLRDWVKANAPRLVESDIHLGVVIASLVPDTKVGREFRDYFFNLMDQDQREAVRGSAIPALGVVRGIRMILDSNIADWPTYPYNLYAYRDGGADVYRDSFELSAMYTKPYRF